MATLPTSRVSRKGISGHSTDSAKPWSVRAKGLMALAH